MNSCLTDKCLVFPFSFTVLIQADNELQPTKATVPLLGHYWVITRSLPVITALEANDYQDGEIMSEQLNAMFGS